MRLRERQIHGKSHLIHAAAWNFAVNHRGFPQAASDRRQNAFRSPKGATVVIWRKMEHKAPIQVSGKTLGAILVGVVGALMLGVGMCLSMLFGKMALGIVVGVIGMVVLLMLIPLTKGIK